MTEFRELAHALNNAIERSSSQWRRLPIWDTDGYDVNHVHAVHSTLLHLIGDAPVKWVSLVVDKPADTVADLRYTLVVWTENLAVRLHLAEGDETPTATAVARSSIERVDLLKAPIVSTNVFGNPSLRLRARIVYPAFTVEAEDARSDWLPEALDSFLSDLVH